MTVNFNGGLQQQEGRKHTNGASSRGDDSNSSGGSGVCVKSTLVVVACVASCFILDNLRGIGSQVCVPIMDPDSNGCEPVTSKLIRDFDDTDDMGFCFSKYLSVFDGSLTFVAEEAVSDEKLIYMAGVASNLLDSNKDGIVDDPNVRTQLNKNNPHMLISDGDPLEPSDSGDDLVGECMERLNEYRGKGEEAADWYGDIFSNEIKPHYLVEKRWETGFEELFDLLHVSGYGPAYPTYLDPNNSSSQLRIALREARGETIAKDPSTADYMYGPNARYFYSDGSCDKACMATEYLEAVTLLQYGFGRENCMEFKGEELTTACKLEDFEEIHKSVSLLAYKFLPLQGPIGNYCDSGYTSTVAKK